jgi:hypothetical protein
MFGRRVSCSDFFFFPGSGKVLPATFGFVDAFAFAFCFPVEDGFDAAKAGLGRGGKTLVP